MLENPRSPRVRAVANLSKRSARDESGLFLLEGPQAVSEALTYRSELVVELFATPTALDRYTNIAEAAVDAGVGDALRTAGFNVFGPNRGAGRIESPLVRGRWRTLAHVRLLPPQ